MIPVLLLMGFAPHLKWRESFFSLDILKNTYVLVGSIVLAVALLLVFTGTVKLSVVVGFGLALWVAISTVKYVVQKKNITSSVMGMVFAHIGVAICSIGIVLSMNYSTERDVYMKLGDTVKFGPYQYHFTNVNYYKGPNYQAEKVQISIYKNNKLEDDLYPELRLYNVSDELMKKTSIDMNIYRDLYVAVDKPVKNLGWPVRIYSKPFIRWIWAGGLLMVLEEFCQQLIGVID